MSMPELYLYAALSTAHLTQQDIENLHGMAEDPDDWMVFEREPGFFIKMYEELEHNMRPNMSGTFYKAIKELHSVGVRMVEYDRDAEMVDWLTDCSEEVA